MQIFEALDSNNDEEIHYSDFLAAMVNTQIAMHDDLLRTAFKKFDTDRSGHITVKNLKEVLGATFEGKSVKELLTEADQLKDNRISYAEFVSYLRGHPLEKNANTASEMMDMQSSLISSNGRAILKLKATLRGRMTSLLLAEEGHCCCLSWCWPATLIGDCMPTTRLVELIR